MARLSVDDVINRAKEMRKHRETIKPLYDDAIEYCRPDLVSHAGEDTAVEIFDDTAVESVPKFSARFQEALIPNDLDWFMFELPEFIKNRIREEVGDIAAEPVIDEIELDLQRQSDVFFDYIHRSNLSIVSDEAFCDFAIGTMGFWINETDDQAMPFRFSVIPLKEALYGEGPDKTIDDVGREYELEAQNVMGKWVDGNIHDNVKRLAKDDPSKKVKILEITIMDRVNKKWGYHVIDVDNNHEIMFATFDENPAIALRYRRNASEVWGRGPCLFKMPTIKVLNKREEYVLRSEHRAAGGIFLAADDGVIDPYTTQIVPDTIIPVADTERSLRELPYTARIDVLEERRRNQQEEVKRAFFAHTFANPMDPVRSATEISIMYQEMIRDMGGSFGRIKREFLDQLVIRITGILVRRGLMKPIAAQRDVINYRYTSPIAKAQDMKELESITNAISYTNNLLGPEITAEEYNRQRVARAIGDRLGTDKSLLNTEDEKKAMQQQQQAMMAQQQQQQQQQPQ